MGVGGGVYALADLVPWVTYTFMKAMMMSDIQYTGLEKHVAALSNHILHI